MAGAFLSGYLAQQQADAQTGNQDIQRMGALSQLAGALQKQQAEGAIKGVLSDPSLTPEQRNEKLVRIPGGIGVLSQFAQYQQAMRKETAGQPIGAGGLRMPDGTIVAPAARPVEQRPVPIGAGGLQMPDGTVVPPVSRPAAPSSAIQSYTLAKEQGYKGTILDFQRELSAAGRAPASSNAPPVTPVTLADPNNPGKTIVIDGRTREVLGEGPRLSASGATDQKLSLGLPDARLRTQTMAQNLDRLAVAIDELDQDEGLSRITGTVFGRTPNITNTATGAQAKLNSIKSNIFQSSLQAMREASKTGGAIGSVSDREGDKLERTIAALDQAQGTPDFKNELKKARAQVRLSKELIQNAFDEQYEGVQPYSPSPTKPNAANNSVTLPDGRVKTFPSAGAAAAFKRAAGL